MYSKENGILSKPPKSIKAVFMFMRLVAIIVTDAFATITDMLYMIIQNKSVTFGDEKEQTSIYVV